MIKSGLEGNGNTVVKIAHFQLSLAGKWQIYAEIDVEMTTKIWWLEKQ